MRGDPGNTKLHDHASDESCFDGSCGTNPNQTAKHTPGPWRVGTGATIVGVRPDGSGLPLMVAQCVRPIHGTEQEDNAYLFANARLIAQAPALLAVLRTVEAAFNVKEIDPLVAFATIEKVRATIARVEGRDAR